MTRVRDLSEEQILKHIVPLLSSGKAALLGIGDDSAVLAVPDGKVVVSTDVMVEGTHFRTHWSTGYDVGRHAAARNLADIAAMGAVPIALVASVVMPGDTEMEWVTGLARGLSNGCEPVGAGVVGGDLSNGPCLMVSVTAHGDLEGRSPVTRSGAQPGDVVAYSGVRGWSAAGLALLEVGLVRSPLDSTLLEIAQGVFLEDVWERLVSSHLRPIPPLGSGVSAARVGATAMIDLSDGLLRDAGRVAKASGVRIDFDAEAFAADRNVLSSAAQAVAVGAGWGDVGPDAPDIDELVYRWIWAGGEDHGLLATFPSGTLLPSGWAAVGQVLDSQTVQADGEEAVVTIGGQIPTVQSGWDHFQK